MEETNDYISFTVEEYKKDNPGTYVYLCPNNPDSSLNGLLIYQLDPTSDSSLFKYRVKVRECNNQSIFIGGLPAGFNNVKGKNAHIVGTKIKILEYLGTYEFGILYVDRKVNISPGNYINICI